MDTSKIFIWDKSWKYLSTLLPNRQWIVATLDTQYGSSQGTATAFSLLRLNLWNYPGWKILGLKRSFLTSCLKHKPKLLFLCQETLHIHCFLRRLWGSERCSADCGCVFRSLPTSSTATWKRQGQILRLPCEWIICFSPLMPTKA